MSLSNRCPTWEISIHALREEGDLLRLSVAWIRINFYPRPPRGGRPLYSGKFFRISEFLSTPSARRATHYRRRKFPGCKISIHALREEGDENR